MFFGDGSGGFGAAPTVAVPDGPRGGALALARVHPNPVSARAAIRFTLPGAGRVTLRVLDAAGRHVTTLENGFLPAGDHVAEWDRRDHDGTTVAPGIYICELRFGGKVVSRRLTVLR